MAFKTTKLTDSALEALANSTIADKILTLPSTLDRNTYTELDKIFKQLGGKWNKGKKGHVFTDDPTFEIQTVVKTGEVMLLSKNGYFPTPRDLAEQLVGYGDIWDGGLSVLEPSAGSGGLADVIRELHPDAELLCIEIQPKLVGQLLAKGHIAACVDFLEVEPEPVFDRVVMNPPFENHGDMLHIAHAFKFLKPGGRLAAIGGGSWQYRKDKKTSAFQELLDNYCMMDEPVPAGAFKESGTMVSTRIVVLWKPGNN